MNDVAGVIFSNLHDRSIPELTAKRTMGAIPFFASYRMVDFPLSAMANAGIRNLSVIAHHNYGSLAEHIGSGADWGIPTDRGGVRILSPYMTAYAKRDGEKYSSRLDTLKSICNNLERMKEKYIVMCDCDCVFNVDVRAMVEFHVSVGADVTVAADQKIETDREGRITCVDQSLTNAFDMNVNMWVFNRDYLVGMVKNAVSQGYSNMVSQIICKKMLNDRFFEYKVPTEFVRLGSLADYFRVSMKLLHDRRLLDGLTAQLKSRRALCKPTQLGGAARVSSSVVAPGCDIEGCVENCIVFGGVTVEKGAVVRNSILFPSVRIAGDSELDFVIADRNTDIKEGNVLSGCRVLPYFIGKNKII